MSKRFDIHDIRTGRNESDPGTLEVICGCMFGGKTEALIDRVSALPPGRAAIFKNAIDDRYDIERIVSHGRRSCPATPIARCQDILDRVDGDVELVAIDEGHFFDAMLPEVCAALRDRRLDVVVTTLDLDSWGRPFPTIERLRHIADAVTVKTAACARCQRRATMTQMLVPFHGRKIVGGPESFEPRCAQCWTLPPESNDQSTREASNTGPSVQHNS